MAVATLGERFRRGIAGSNAEDVIRDELRQRLASLIETGPVGAFTKVENRSYKVDGMLGDTRGAFLICDCPIEGIVDWETKNWGVKGRNTSISFVPQTKGAEKIDLGMPSKEICNLINRLERRIASA